MYETKSFRETKMLKYWSECSLPRDFKLVRLLFLQIQTPVEKKKVQTMQKFMEKERKRLEEAAAVSCRCIAYDWRSKYRHVY